MAITATTIASKMQSVSDSRQLTTSGLLVTGRIGYQVNISFVEANPMRAIGSRIGACLFLLAALSGCAIGNKHEYAGITPDLMVTGQHTVAVIVVDNRPYVATGGKGPDFVGLQRGGFGNPFSVTTKSGKPLASDIADDVVAALNKRGLRSSGKTLPPGTTVDGALKAAAGAGADRGLLLDIREWKSDTYNGTALIFDVEARVCDATGASLADVVKTGNQDLGSSFMDPPGHAKEAVPLAFKATMESLLNDPKVVSALQ